MANGVRTVADEKAAAVRPYLLHIKPGNILGWKSEQQNGNRRLTQMGQDGFERHSGSYRTGSGQVPGHASCDTPDAPVAALEEVRRR